MKRKVVLSLVLIILFLTSLVPLQASASTDVTGEWLANQIYSPTPSQGLTLDQRKEFVALIQLFLDAEGTVQVCQAFSSAFTSAFSTFAPTSMSGQKCTDLVLAFVDFFQSRGTAWTNAKTWLTSGNDSIDQPKFLNAMKRSNNNNAIITALGNKNLNQADITDALSKLKLCFTFLKWNYDNQTGPLTCLFSVNTTGNKGQGYRIGYLSVNSNYSGINSINYTPVKDGFNFITNYFGSFSHNNLSTSSSSPTKNDRIQLLVYLKTNKLIDWNTNVSEFNIW